MFGILKINLNTNIPGFKKAFDYNPSMTVKGSSKDDIIYFPSNIILTLKDLGGKNTGKHDKIKSFLSENRLKTIINTKNNATESSDAANQNIKLILKLLFSNDENLFLNETAYTILDSEIGAKSDEVLLFKQKKSSQSDSSSGSQQIIKLHTIVVKLILFKGGKISSTTKGCERQKLLIDEKTKLIKTFFDKTSEKSPSKQDDNDQSGKKIKDKKKKINIPSGYINISNWYKVPRNKIFGDREYYVNYETGETQYELPVTFKYRNKIDEWSTEAYGDPPPPPSAPPSAPPSENPKSKVTFAPSGGKKTRKSRAHHKYNKTLKASSLKISRALRRKNRDGGNISVYFATETPKKYFTNKEIDRLNK